MPSQGSPDFSDRLFGHETLNPLLKPPVDNLRWSAPVPIGQFSDGGSRGQRGEWGAMCHSDLEGVKDMDDETYQDLVEKGYFRTGYNESLFMSHKLTLDDSNPLKVKTA